MATLQEVRETLEAAGEAVTSERRLPNDTGWQLRLDGVHAIVNVFDTGTFNVQGRGRVTIEPLLAGLGTGTARATQRTKVFVVYGHDERACEQLEAMLRRWQLEPIILGQLPSDGQTIIEKLERYMTDEEVGFAIVLATPDDEGHRVGHEEERAYRARQNVVLELGMVLAYLGRAKVAVLLKEAAQMERPSDIQGLIYLPFTKDVQEQKVALAQEMTRRGYAVRVDRL